MFLSSCFHKSSFVSNKPVAKVNNNILTVKEFSNLLAIRLKDLDSLAAKDPRVNERTKNEILNVFIVRSLMLDWAIKNKIDVLEEDVEREVKNIRSLYPDDLSFRRVLAEEGISFADWKINLKMNLLEKKVSQEINKKIKPSSEEELQTFYAENKESFRKKESVFIHQIVLKDEARAEFIRELLKKEKFSDLSKKYSIGPEGQNGGILGWVEKGSIDFYDPVFKWPLNQVGAPIKTPFGFLIVKVEKKTPDSIPSFSEIKTKLERRIIELKEKSEYVSWMDTQLRSSKVYKDLELINSLKIETQGQSNEKK
ncbi:MAG: peptidyl-prolyl cis-trans isomerase [Deltaproteobacteria bacterium]|nr:peptidyl-prolyl cis-trans isomerase [Deltaproteobacteria bacterium]